MGQHNFPVRNFWDTLVKLLNENLLRYVLLITFERWPLVSSSSSSPSSSILSCCMHIYIWYISIYIDIYIYLWTTLWSLVIEHEVIKKKPYKFGYAAFTLSFFSSLSFCRLSALITIKEVYAHAAAIQEIIRSASIDLGHSYLCCKNASWSKLTVQVATCSHNVFRRGPFF